MFALIFGPKLSISYYKIQKSLETKSFGIYLARKSTLTLCLSGYKIWLELKWYYYVVYKIKVYIFISLLKYKYFEYWCATPNLTRDVT